MLKIYLARHGQDEDNANGILNGHRDLPLTRLGKEQVTELALAIKDVGVRFDAVYTSWLVRHLESALIIIRQLGITTISILGDLIERDFGAMTGKPVTDIEELCGSAVVKTQTITYFLEPEGAETFPDLMERGRRVLREIQDMHPTAGSVLVVTSGDIGKMIYAAYYGLPWMDVLTNFHFGNSELLLLSPDCKEVGRHLIKIRQHNH